MGRPKKAKPPNPHYKLAKFIIKKFVDTRELKKRGVWPRELVLCYKLTKKYDSYYFWALVMECKFRSPSLLGFFTEAAKKALDYKWKNYQKNLKMMKKFKVGKEEVKEPVDPLDDIIDEVYDFIPPTYKPKSVLEFCRD